MAVRGRISILSFGSLQDAIALADLAGRVNGGSVKIKWPSSEFDLRRSQKR
jgi:hypothetical protein